MPIPEDVKKAAAAAVKSPANKSPTSIVPPTKGSGDLVELTTDGVDGFRIVTNSIDADGKPQSQTESVFKKGEFAHKATINEGGALPPQTFTQEIHITESGEVWDNTKTSDAHGTKKIYGDVESVGYQKIEGGNFSAYSTHQGDFLFNNNGAAGNTLTIPKPFHDLIPGDIKRSQGAVVIPLPADALPKVSALAVEKKPEGDGKATVKWNHLITYEFLFDEKGKNLGANIVLFDPLEKTNAVIPLDPEKFPELFEQGAKQREAFIAEAKKIKMQQFGKMAEATAVQGLQHSLSDDEGEGKTPPPAPQKSRKR